MNAKKLLMLLVPPLLVILTTIMVITGFGHSLELSFYTAVTTSITPALTSVMLVVTNIGGAVPVAILCLILLFIPNIRLQIAIPALISLCISALLNPILKNNICRTRPDILHLTSAGGYSFPSGHSMNNAAFYMAIAFMLIFILKSRKQKALLSALLSIPPLLIGFSRIYLGVHYLFDVLAGLTAGLWIAYIVCYFWIKNVPASMLTFDSNRR